MGLTSSTVDLNGEEAQFVKKTIQSNPVVMFSKTACPYCRTAKKIFGEMQTEVKVVELDKMREGAILQDILGAMTPARTVPRVFINGECIGGCSELKALYQSGRLQHML